MRRVVLAGLAAALSVGTGALPVMSAQVQTFQVAGTVTTATREPVLDAVVALLTGTGAIPDTPELQQLRPVTAPDARFQWPAVPAGAYRVVVASAAELKDWPAAATVQRVSARAFPLTLTPNQGSAQMTLIVEVIAEPTHAIRLVTATVSTTMLMGGPGGPPPGAPRRPGTTPAGPRPMTGPASITGVLTDPQGRPLPGIPVQAGRRQSPAAPATSAFLPIGPPATTDATGAYRIAGLQPGAYVVGAIPWNLDMNRFDESSARIIPAETDPSGRRVALWTTYYPGVVSTRAARVVTIDAGETGAIDFVVHRGPVSTVSVNLGPPDPNVRGMFHAFLMPVAVPEQFGQRNGLRAIPDSAGIYTFADIQDGDYVFTHSGISGWARESVSVRGSASLAFTLKPFITVSGRVDLRPTRVPAGPDVVTTLTVSLTPSPLTSGSPLLRVPVSADGTFSIPRVPGGPYVLTLAPAAVTWVPLSGVLNGQDSLDRPVELSGNVMDALLTVTDVATTVQGRVIGMAAGSVVVFSSDSRHWTGGGTRRVKVTSILPAGVFTVTGLPPGTYHAAAFPEGTRIVNAALEEAKGRTVPFELAIGEQKEIIVR